MQRRLAELHSLPRQPLGTSLALVDPSLAPPPQGSADVLPSHDELEIAVAAYISEPPEDKVRLH